MTSHDCDCPKEEDHGLQASAAKQRIDEQAKPVPPAVGEFAVHEIDRLSAHLAKYEDAEGRPKTAKWEYCPECGCEQVHHEEGDHKQCADCYQEWFADMDYSDVVRVHLGGKYRDKDAVIERLNNELAALKAQPSGVVLPERDDASAYEAFYTEKAKTLPLPLGNTPLRYSGGQYINDFALFGWMVWEACLSEVARLNQPASAGDERSEVWDGKSLPYGWVAVQMLFDGPDYPEDFAYGPPRMMERLSGILERYYATRFAPKVEPVNTKGSRKALSDMNAKLRAKVGRLERELAALSANHSEQVMVPRDLLERIAGELLSGPILDGVTLKAIMHQQKKLREDLRALLAAPPAGSQKEQGE